MKAYKVTLLVLPLNGDFENEEHLKALIEWNKHPEFATVRKIETAEIGEWSDDHPLNKTNGEIDSYFQPPQESK